MINEKVEKKNFYVNRKLLKVKTEKRVPLLPTRVYGHSQYNKPRSVVLTHRREYKLKRVLLRKYQLKKKEKQKNCETNYTRNQFTARWHRK